MFYEKRRIICTALIVVALLSAFFMGKKIGYHSEDKSSNVQKSDLQIKKEDENYNQNLNIVGDGYTISYCVTEAILLNKNKLNFNINILLNNNVKQLKVIVKNETNENLDCTPNASSTSNSLNYTVNLDDKLKEISVTVYPLTDQMSKNNNLDLSNSPYKITKINIDSIKKQMIQDLSN